MEKCIFGNTVLKNFFQMSSHHQQLWSDAGVALTEQRDINSGKKTLLSQNWTNSMWNRNYPQSDQFLAMWLEKLCMCHSFSQFWPHVVTSSSCFNTIQLQLFFLAQIWAQWPSFFSPPLPSPSSYLSNVPIVDSVCFSSHKMSLSFLLAAVGWETTKPENQM